jgi:DNA-binding IclR family transcriptional regulator
MAFGRGPSLSEPLQRHAPDTITDPKQLADQLKVVRRTEIATAIDELEPGLAAMAAPVRGARGDVVAALSITGPTLRLNRQRIRELTLVLTDEARLLSGRLGHPDEGEHAA